MSCHLTAPWSSPLRALFRHWSIPSFRSRCRSAGNSPAGGGPQMDGRHCSCIFRLIRRTAAHHSFIPLLYCKKSSKQAILLISEPSHACSLAACNHVYRISCGTNGSFESQKQEIGIRLPDTSDPRAAQSNKMSCVAGDQFASATTGFIRQAC
jgi:hypothetical protein